MTVTPLDASGAERPTRAVHPPQASIVQIIREVWDARDLVMQFVRRDLTLRYVQAVMGFAWALLMPLLIVGAGMMFRIVLSTLANSPLEGKSIASLAAKALPWAFFSGALSTATSSIIGNSNLISKVYFPREVLPLSTVIAQCPDLVVGLVVVARRDAIPRHGWSVTERPLGDRRAAPARVVHGGLRAVPELREPVLSRRQIHHAGRCSTSASSRRPCSSSRRCSGPRVRRS